MSLKLPTHSSYIGLLEKYQTYQTTKITESHLYIFVFVLHTILGIDVYLSCTSSLQAAPKVFSHCIFRRYYFDYCGSLLHSYHNTIGIVTIITLLISIPLTKHLRYETTLPYWLLLISSTNKIWVKPIITSRTALSLSFSTRDPSVELRKLCKFRIWCSHLQPHSHSTALVAWLSCWICDTR